MTNQDIFYLLLAILGIALVYPLSFKYFTDKKKWVSSAGLIIFHIGVFGLAWDKLQTFLFISILLVELGIVILWDPFHFFRENYKRHTFLAGALAIFGGVVISLSSYTFFPIWFWAIPILLYLFSTFFKNLNPYARIALILAVGSSVIYLGIMAKRTFDLTQKQQKSHVPLSVQAVSQELAQPSGPITSAIQNFDQRFHNLEQQKQKLETEANSLREENKRLKEDLKKKDQILHNMKGLTEKL